MSRKYPAIVILILIAVTMVASRVEAQPACSKEGDPAFYIDFGAGMQDVVAGGTFCWSVGPTNLGFVSGTCTGADTFCMYAYDSGGWIITGDPPLETCHTLDPGYLWWQEICVTVPCEVEICDFDTLTMVVTYCDGAPACRHDCSDCEDPNWYEGNPYFSTDTVVLHIVESPPSLYILQDSLYLVDWRQAAAYVPFSICNSDMCSDSTVYDYVITSSGHVGGSFPQGGSSPPVAGGECDKVYAVVNANVATICDFDTLTIVAWDEATGTAYDTCVQIIHVIEYCCYVPLLTAPVVTVLVLAVILVAALILKRRASAA